MMSPLITWFYVMTFYCVLEVTHAHYRPGTRGTKCERITVPLCQDMRYNLTRTPNLVGHVDQDEAARYIYEFLPLIQIGCSPLLKFFLCSMYTPMCTVQVEELLVIPPCRSMCLEVKKGCEPVLKRFNFAWPDQLNCSKLPASSDRTYPCIHPPQELDSFPHLTTRKFGALPAWNHRPDQGSADTHNKLSDLDRIAYDKGKVKDLERNSFVVNDHHSSDESASDESYGTDYVMSDSNNKIDRTRGNKDDVGIALPDSISLSNPVISRLLEVFRESAPANKVNDQDMMWNEPPHSTNPDDPANPCPLSYYPREYRGNYTCSPRCDADILFSSRDKRFMSLWTITWSALSLILSTFTCLTCLIVDRTRLQYPERPVVYISLSYLVLSGLYLTMSLVPRVQISCTRSSQSIPADRVLLRPDHITDNVACSIVSIVMYYFTMSGALWWAMFSAAWFLAAVRKWGREAVQSYVGHLHALAWSLPALQTAILLGIGRGIEGDELTGGCRVGAVNSTILFSFVIAPLGLYYTVGTVLILAGFLALFSVRYRLRRVKYACPAPSNSLVQPIASQAATDLHKLERLMIKVSLFSIVYILSQAGVIGCLIYEHLHKDDWIKQSMSRTCLEHPARIGPGGCHVQKSIPPLEVFSVRLAGEMLIGVCSVVWIGSGKSFEAWRRFCCGRWLKKGGGRRDVIYELRDYQSIPLRRPCYMETIKQENDRSDSRSEIYATLNSKTFPTLERIYYN